MIRDVSEKISPGDIFAGGILFFGWMDSFPITFIVVCFT